MRKSLLFFLFFVALSAAPQSFATEAEYARVVSVADGDTVDIMTHDHHRVRVRLAEIDAPEHGQPYGEAARTALDKLCYQKKVRVDVLDQDSYGRLVAHLYLGSKDLNREMVREGAAWAYRRWLRDKSLLAVEKEARAAHRGLWALPEDQQVPPWKWRQQLHVKAN